MPKLARNLTLKTSLIAAAGAAVAFGALAPAASAQEVALPEVHSVEIDLTMDSGPIQSSGRTEIAFTDSVVVRDASWMRLFFDSIELGTNAEGESAKLRLTSMLDGAVQVLDRDAVDAWQNTTAVFNGDWILIEVIQPAGASDSRVVLDRANTGEPDPDMTRSICGSADDRILSDDPRSGRVWPIGCTAWLVDDCNKCMLTAGHCGPSSTSVIQFNVPLSTPTGTPVAPPPEDQYPVDPASIQSNGGQGVGDDWSYFGTVPNTSTGLTAYEAQGEQAYSLGTVTSSTDSIRITGFGSTTSPVDPSWYLAQKTHAGPFVGVFGNSLQYQPDTSGGNSGSAVVDDGTGLAVGIHTHAGCNLSSGQGNQGTDIRFSEIQNALANPQGICAGPQPMALNQPVPDYLDSGANAFVLSTNEACGTEPILSSARMLLDRGNGADAIAGQVDNDGNITFTTPNLDCAEVVSFSFEIDTVDGETFAIPSSGSLTRVAVDQLDTTANYDFEVPQGFADASSVALDTGAWERGVPQGGGSRQDPATDADGSGSCWLTENRAGDSDVDEGPAVLVSPAFDLSSQNAPEMSFALWVGTNNPGDDPVTIELSDDNGQNWTLVETVTASTNGWETKSYNVSSFVSLTDSVRLRISATDSPNNSILEVGFDALRIDSVICDAEPCTGDVNGSNSVDLDDLLLVLGNFGTIGEIGDPGVDGDADGDNDVDLDDLLIVLGAFGSNC